MVSGLITSARPTVTWLQADARNTTISQKMRHPQETWVWCFFFNVVNLCFMFLGSFRGGSKPSTSFHWVSFWEERNSANSLPFKNLCQKSSKKKKNAGSHLVTSEAFVTKDPYVDPCIDRFLNIGVGVTCSLVLMCRLFKFQMISRVNPIVTQHRVPILISRIWWFRAYKSSQMRMKNEKTKTAWWFQPLYAY